MGTLIVSIILLAVVSLIIVSMIKAKKRAAIPPVAALVLAADVLPVLQERKFNNNTKNS